MGREVIIRIITPAKDVDLAITKKLTGNQLLQKVGESLQMKDICYYRLQYQSKKDEKKYIEPQKRVLDHKLNKDGNAMPLTLKVVAYPTAPSKLEDATSKMIMFREVENQLKSRAWLCSPSLTETFSNLALSENIDEYLRLAESLGDYGYFQFHLKRDDGMPCKLSINSVGITHAADDMRHYISFEEIQKMDFDKRILKFIFRDVYRDPLLFSSQSDQQCQEITEAFDNNQKVFLLTKDIA